MFNFILRFISYNQYYRNRPALSSSSSKGRAPSESSSIHDSPFGKSSGTLNSSQFVSDDDEGSFSVTQSPRKDSLQEYSGASAPSQQTNPKNKSSFISMKSNSSQSREESPPSYPQVMNNFIYREKEAVYEEAKQSNSFSFDKTFDVDPEAGKDEDSISIDAPVVSVTSSEKEIEDEVIT